MTDLTKKALRHYAEDPVSFCWDMMGIKCDDWQVEAFEDLYRDRFLAIKAGSGVGKCMHWADEMPDADGIYHSVGSLIGKHTTVLLGNKQSAGAFVGDNGIQECLEIETQAGRFYRRTLEHPFLTTEGWIQTCDLEPGMDLRTLQDVPFKGTGRFIDPNEYKILAYMIGDGDCCNIRFSQKNSKVLLEMATCCSELGMQLHHYKSNASHDYDIRQPGVFRSIFRQYGILGKTSSEKRIPRQIFEMSNEDVAVFLSRLFTTDGWAVVQENRNHTPSAHIGYASISYNLVLDIQRLLRRFNIYSKIRRKRQRLSYGDHRIYYSWELSMHAAISLAFFIDKIGIYGKEEAVGRVKDAILQRDLNRIQEVPHKDKILSIKSIGKHRTASIEVPEYHHYFTDTIEHNTEWLSMASMHFLGTRPFSIIPSTAPSQHQLEDLLWQKHASNINRSDYLKSMMSWTQRKVAVKGYEGEWFAIARTARVTGSGKVAEGLQGFHASRDMGGLLYLVDEASGVEDEIFPAIEGALSSDNTFAILAANPTRLTGYFHAVFTHPKLAGLYKLRTVNCLDSKFVEERYVTMMKAMYGEDHPIYKIKVLGDFPSSDIELLFAYSDIERMKFNDVLDQRGDRTKIEMGIDVGRTTAKTTVCIRKGLRILKYEWKQLTGTTIDAVEQTQWILNLVHAYEPEVVKIDANGIGGPIFDSLSRVYPKVFRPVIGQASAADTKRSRYVNLRAQGYWEFKNLMPSICCDAWPDEIFDEMHDMRYKLVNGKVQIESKEDMQRRNKPSPDFTDATVYAFLDADDCMDKFNPLIIPTMLSNFNDTLEKKNPLLHLGTGKGNTVTSSKWSALHG